MFDQPQRLRVVTGFEGRAEAVVGDPAVVRGIRWRGERFVVGGDPRQRLAEVPALQHAGHVPHEGDEFAMILGHRAPPLVLTRIVCRTPDSRGQCGQGHIGPAARMTGAAVS
ncbi:hypothetical protein [Nocardia huaxiensis]|uniref:hypothetical protein n=1 Tax=Nocardia huaxiensis TaxID=2755382 RepID=UPI001E373D1E|nr:hypothetical protein [Nocardia huaxiensis]UFS98715.1 hypothetical protein LPY97_12880 [Nocardia huaxiensis]